jgi:hypothetical protein
MDPPPNFTKENTCLIFGSSHSNIVSNNYFEESSREEGLKIDDIKKQNFKKVPAGFYIIIPCPFLSFARCHESDMLFQKWLEKMWNPNPDNPNETWLHLLLNTDNYNIQIGEDALPPLDVQECLEKSKDLEAIMDSASSDYPIRSREEETPEGTLRKTMNKINTAKSWHSNVYRPDQMMPNINCAFPTNREPFAYLIDDFAITKPPHALADVLPTTEYYPASTRIRRRFNIQNELKAEVWKMLEEEDEENKPREEMSLWRFIEKVQEDPHYNAFENKVIVWLGCQDLFVEIYHTFETQKKFAVQISSVLTKDNLEEYTGFLYSTIPLSALYRRSLWAIWQILEEQYNFNKAWFEKHDKDTWQKQYPNATPFLDPPPPLWVSLAVSLKLTGTFIDAYIAGLRTNAKDDGGIVKIVSTLSKNENDRGRSWSRRRNLRSSRSSSPLKSKQSGRSRSRGGRGGSRRKRKTRKRKMRRRRHTHRKRRKNKRKRTQKKALKKRHRSHKQKNKRRI